MIEIMVIVSIVAAFICIANLRSLTTKINDLNRDFDSFRTLGDTLQTNNAIILGELKTKFSEIKEEELINIRDECSKVIRNYFEDLEKHGRCKKCNRICSDGSKFCHGCGEPFYIGNDQDIHARLLKCMDDVMESDNGITADFSWECLDCHEDHDEEVDLHEDLEKERIIYKLKCNSCDEFVGEVLIEVEDNQVSFSEVYKTGTLKINHECRKHTK